MWNEQISTIRPATPEITLVDAAPVSCLYAPGLSYDRGPAACCECQANPLALPDISFRSRVGMASPMQRAGNALFSSRPIERCPHELISRRLN